MRIIIRWVIRKVYPYACEQYMNYCSAGTLSDGMLKKEDGAVNELHAKRSLSLMGLSMVVLV